MTDQISVSAWQTHVEMAPEVLGDCYDEAALGPYRESMDRIRELIDAGLSPQVASSRAFREVHWLRAIHQVERQINTSPIGEEYFRERLDQLRRAHRDAMKRNSPV